MSNLTGTSCYKRENIFLAHRLAPQLLIFLPGLIEIVKWLTLFYVA